MCSAGGGDFRLDIEELKLDRYRCNDCGDTFEGIGENVICQLCWSENVVKI